MKVGNAIKEDHNSVGAAGGGQQSKIKYSQRFCDKWLRIFKPWLERCKDDPDNPFCRACQCRLNCNRCHLQRHERTTKHQRNLEVLISKGEVAARQNLSIRQERSKYYHRRKRTTIEANSIDTYDDGDVDTAGDEDADDTDSFEPNGFQFVQTKPSSLEERLVKKENSTNDINDGAKMCIATQNKDQSISSTTPTTKAAQSSDSQKADTKRRGLKLLMQIQKDKNDLMESFKELMGGSGSCAEQQAEKASSPAKEKHSVDLFFESVSTSVKQFPPQLISEAKLRVSQLICELEMRGLKAATARTTTSAASGSDTIAITNAFTVNQAASSNCNGLSVTESCPTSRQHHYDTLS